MDKLVFRVRKYHAFRLTFKLPQPTNPLSSTLLLVCGFGGFISLGAIMLLFPISSQSGQFTSPINALFTATSAVCVTGLVVVDTGTYWSGFGQGVLATLFQVGGLGFLIGTTLLLFAISGRFGLKERLVISEQAGIDELGSALSLVTKISIFALVIEGVGAGFIYLNWIISGNTSYSFGTALFHSISAFNNCGMDLFGEFKSLIVSQGDYIFLLLTALLIIAGGTGYIVLADVLKRRKFVKLLLDTKLVLVTTGMLLLFSTLFILLAEFKNPLTLGPMPFTQKLIVAFFQSVSPRTAGFTAVDIAGLRQATIFFIMLLMFIGGAAGSTAGGVKVNTIGVLSVTAISLAKGKHHISAFGRQLTNETVFRAITLFLVYLMVVGVFTVILSVTENQPLDSILFETFSALGTVGLTFGITPELSSLGRLVLVIAMLVGRLGPLAFMAFLVHRQQTAELEYPHENIRLG